MASKIAFDGDFNCHLRQNQACCNLKSTRVIENSVFRELLYFFYFLIAFYKEDQ